MRWFFSAQPPTRLDNGHVLAMGFTTEGRCLGGQLTSQDGKSGCSRWAGVGGCQVGAQGCQPGLVGLGWQVGGLDHEFFSDPWICLDQSIREILGSNPNLHSSQTHST